MAFRPSLFLLCGMLLLGASVPAVHAGAREDARAALTRGTAALDRGDARTARVELMNAIKADPGLAAARVAQARALLLLGDGVAAREELDRAVGLGVPTGAIRHLRAHAALLSGQPDEALAETRASDADPRQALLLARYEGQALKALGKYEQAALAFDRALGIGPGDAAAWADVARLREATGDMAAALDAVERALTLAPDSADIATLRGVMARRQQGLQTASLWFDKALKHDPDYVPALIEQAATLADLGKAGQALTFTRQALALSPGLPRAFFVQAVIAARAGKHDLARSLLTRTGGALDHQPATRLLRGVLHLHAGNATLAAGELRPLLKAQPLNLRARLLLARASYDDGQYDEAEQTLFPIIERVDAGSYALTLGARIQEALGNDVTAAALLTRASVMMPGPSVVFRGAGSPVETVEEAAANPAASAPNLRHIRALLEVGRSDAAVARAAMLRAANPGALWAMVALGDCLIADGQPAEAAAAYERAARLRFDEELALRLVDAWQRAGKPDRARQVLGLLLAQNPMSVAGQRLAASTLLAAGEYRRALAILSTLSQRLGNEDALLMADLARAHIGLDNADNALAYAAHAYRIQPMSAVTTDVFGWALLKSRPGDARALELLQKAENLAPAEPLVKLHLGQAYAAFGKRGKARLLLHAAASSHGFARRAEAQAALNAL